METRERVEASLCGTLATDPLPRLLAGLVVGTATGTLELAGSGEVLAELVFAQGKLAKIRVPRAPLYLGSVVYELGFVSAEDVNATLLEVARAKRLHGAILVERRLLTPTQLRQCLLQQAGRKLHGLFALPAETTFQFFPRHDALADFGGDDGPLCDLRPSIWFGIREFPPAEHIEATLAATARGGFRLSSTEDPRDLGLDAEELALAECFRGVPREVSEIVHVSTLGRRRTEALLYALLVTGHLVRAASLRAPESGVRPKVVPAPSAPWDPLAAVKMFDRAFAAMQAGKLEAAEMMCREALAGEPGDVNHEALRVWLHALRPEGQSELATRRAIVDLSRIIETHDECAHAHFFRGQLFKRIGRDDRAASDFKSTLEHDPKRMDALAELRLYVSRRRRGA